MKLLIILCLLLSSPSYAWCPLLPNQALRVTIKHTEQLKQADIYIRNLVDSVTRLELTSVVNGTSFSGLDLAAFGITSVINAAPLAEDADLDGAADHFWILSTEGQVWRIPWLQNQFGVPLLMADLSDENLYFHTTISLIRSRLPAHLAPNSWRNIEQHQLLLLATEPQQEQDVLFNIRFAVSGRQPVIIKSKQLLDRTTLTDAERNQQYSVTDWRGLLNTAGWKLQLSGRVSSLPKVIAGVIYAPAVTITDHDTCQFDSEKQELYAVQLYTASQIYAHRRWTIPYLEQATLRLREQPDKRLALVLSNERQSISLIDSLLKISAECHNCTAPLTLDKFPLWQRLATYRDERGAY